MAHADNGVLRIIFPSCRLMSNLSVCHIGFNFFPGQGLTIFYEFARHQARQGLGVFAIAPGRPDEPAFEIKDGVRIHRVPLRSIGRFSLDRLWFLIQASRILRKNDFDLIHVYAFVGAGLLPWLAGRHRARWLYDCQTSAIKPPLLWLQNVLIRAESWSYDVITVLSEGIRDIVFGPRAAVEAIVPLGADFDHFRPQTAQTYLFEKLGISPDAQVLTYCGTLDHNRHMDRLISAFALTNAHAPDAVLLMIGDGSALEELKRQARDLNLASRVVFTGYIPYSDIPAYLSITTIALAFVVMDPRFQHQPPTKTIEYLAQGLPVIATNTTGNRMFIQDKVNGLLCGDSYEDYGHAMLSLLHNPGQQVCLAACARDSVSGFDWRNIVRMRVIPLYEDILREKR
ncbi:MAG: glycosyltransferase [Thiobacillus sp.]|nr:glycosyltransferase [Thiobacillus sp.]